MAPKRVVVLLSGKGSNFSALIADARASCAAGIGQDRYEIVAAVSNRVEAGGLALAEQAGIAAHTISHKNFASREDFDAALRDLVAAFDPDLVVLAGFMRVLTPTFVDAFAGRMLNIHPSLLPAFPGLHTHAHAIAAGCKFAGCTVHFVTSVLDHGPIVAQACVPITVDDTESTLAAKVLIEEHRILPQAVRDFCAGRLVVAGLRVHVNSRL